VELVSYLSFDHERNAVSLKMDWTADCMDAYLARFQHLPTASTTRELHVLYEQETHHEMR